MTAIWCKRVKFNEREGFKCKSDFEFIKKMSALWYIIVDGGISEGAAT